MKHMLNKQYIAPRVVVSNMRSRFTGKPLTKDELAQVLYALEKTGIEDCFNRVMDDNARFTVSQILEQI